MLPFHQFYKLSVSRVHGAIYNVHVLCRYISVHLTKFFILYFLQMKQIHVFPLLSFQVKEKVRMLQSVVLPWHLVYYSGHSSQHQCL